MNIDFHYYGTYHAALIAGIEKDCAKKIAFYAQFVDECTKSVATKLIKGTCLNPVYTVQSTQGLLKKYGSSAQAFKDAELAEIEPIWTAFHFLPANEKQGQIKKSELICKPNSKLVKTMVKNLIHESLSEKELNCAYIGMVMHILADTWAHRMFAGIASYTLNEVGEVYNMDNVWLKFLYVGSDDIEKNIFVCTPVGLRENSIVYLGHGRIGHLPDYGYQKYRCYKHTGELMEKDNPSDFRDAFVQMVYVMSCVNNKTYKESDLKNAANSIEDEKHKQMEEILKILTVMKSTDKICEQLRKRDGSLPNYSHEEFFKNGKNRDSLGQFFEAARKHRSMVLSEFPQEIIHR